MEITVKKKNLKFLLEKDVFDDGMSAKFKTALQKREQDVKIVEYIPFDENQVFKEFDTDEPIFVYGSINLIKRLQYQKRQDQLRAPMIDYCPWNLFRTSVIYNRLKNFVLTDNYRVMRVAEVLENLPWIFNRHALDVNGAEPPVVFSKSDEGDKSFNGSLYNIVELEQYLQMNIDTEYIKPSDLVVVAEPKQLKQEYRVVVSVNDYEEYPKIVTGSYYMDSGNLLKEPTDDIPERIKDFVAETVSKSNYKPSPVFVVDVAEVLSGELSIPRVVETGSIHMCGLYGCDIQKIVDEIIQVNT